MGSGGLVGRPAAARAGALAGREPERAVLDRMLPGAADAPPVAYLRHERVRQDRIGTGSRPGATTEESAELKRLKKENAELKRQGHAVARCTVERLARELGITGAVRGRRVITTLPGGQTDRASDAVGRNVGAGDPPTRPHPREAGPGP